MTPDLQNIIDEAAQSITKTRRLSDLEQLRAAFLGEKSTLTDYMRKLSQLSADEKRQLGQSLNHAKQQIEALFKLRSDLLKEEVITAQLKSETIDISLAGHGQSLGSLHPVTRTRERIKIFFTHIGFTVAEGPEIEDDYHNFEALNIPANHPARALHDTFYFANGLLLRTHTSPVQIRAMKAGKVPLKIIAPGRVYRCDSDVTHTPMFHQLEGLVIDESANFSELKGLLTEFLQQFFEKKNGLKTGFRAAYFPFTEPSAEVDIQCVTCCGEGCRICSHTGWLEILGCGMVYPHVLEKAGLFPEKISGLCLWFGYRQTGFIALPYSGSTSDV